MLASIKLFLALVLLAVGVLLVLAAYNNWRIVYRLVFGKATLRKRGENYPRFMFYLVGGLLAFLAIMLLFSI